jgi:molybdopterin synthase catalytic subunit
MKRISAVLAVAVACAAPALAAKPPKGGKPNPNLTVTASANAMTFGAPVTLAGTTKNIAAGTTVEVQQNPYPYAGFKPAGKTGVVDPSGNYSIAGVVPQVHTQYRIVTKTSPAVDSGTAFVRVALRVAFKVSDLTPKRGALVRFSGTVAPDHDGKVVLIQKKTATAYTTVARATLLDNGTASSKYSKTLKIRSTGTYRVVAQSADQDHDNGTSRSRTLRVHP